MDLYHGVTMPLKGFLQAGLTIAALVLLFVVLISIILNRC